MICETGTVDHGPYIKQVLYALLNMVRRPSKVTKSFEEVDSKMYTDEKSQECGTQHILLFIDKTIGFEAILIEIHPTTVFLPNSFKQSNDLSKEVDC